MLELEATTGVAPMGVGVAAPMVEQRRQRLMRHTVACQLPGSAAASPSHTDM